MMAPIHDRQLELAVQLWKRGQGTLEIARALGVHEAAVYNGLAHFHERKRKLIVESQRGE